MQEKKLEEISFDGLNISKELLFVLNKNKFTKPTPIQHQVIPVALTGKDVVGIAQTGTGKTLAFAVPLIQNLLASNSQALIILPTRELAIQVDEMISKIGSYFKLKTAVVIGGASINNQIVALKRNPKIIVATPGRLADHLRNRVLNLKNISSVVLDEADRMFDMGFAPQIKEIMDQLPEKRQTLLFSATMPDEIISMANKYMESPLRIEIAPAGTSAEFVEQEMYIVSKEAKSQLLDKILEENKNSGPIIIFVRTRYAAKRIATEVNSFGFSACEMHSDKSLFQRKEALAGFKSGKYKVLVATDIAARGIDVKEISIVINYDLPDDISDYVHRIGRTGRNGASGRAISFVTNQQKFDIKRIERLIKKEIKVSITGVLPDRRKSSIPQEERFYGNRNKDFFNENEYELGYQDEGDDDSDKIKKPIKRFNKPRKFDSRKGFKENKSKPKTNPNFSKFKTEKPESEKEYKGRSAGKRSSYGRSSKGRADSGVSKFNGKRGRSNASKRFR